MDVLIRGGVLVPCDRPGRTLDGDVLIRGGRIVAVGPRASEARTRSVRFIDARGCAVLPGLIQAHVHLCQALFRGMADDLPLLDWLRRRIWPLEAAHDERSLRASAELGIAELLRGGTTTILDMGTVHHHDVVFDAMARTGIRGFSGKAMMDAGDGVPAGLRESTRASLRESEALCTRWHRRSDGRLHYAYAPRFVLSCTEKLLRETAGLARGLAGTLVHSHAAEHPGERRAVRAALGRDDVDALDAWGISGPNTVLAHGVQLSPAQRRAAAERGTRFVHCPSANLKLGSGIAAIHAMRRAGIVVGIGADGAPCNNNLDAWVEMRHAALLSKVRSGTTSLPAADVLQLATRDGARVLGLEAEIGTLEAGKRADVIVVRIDDLHTEPGGDPITRLVYAAQSRDVRHVFVDGRPLVRDGELMEIDAERVAATARVEARRVVARAKLT